MGCSLPGSSVHGISQARLMEWVTISFSKGSSWPRDWTCISCIDRQILYHCSTSEALLLGRETIKLTVRLFGLQFWFCHLSAKLLWVIIFLNIRTLISFLSISWENSCPYYWAGRIDYTIKFTVLFLITCHFLRASLVAQWRRQWHPTPVLLPGKSHGRRSLVGGSPRGC